MPEDAGTLGLIWAEGTSSRKESEHANLETGTVVLKCAGIDSLTPLATALRSAEASRHHKYTHIPGKCESPRAVHNVYRVPQSGSLIGNKGHNAHSRGSIQSTPINSGVEELLGWG